MSGARRFCCAQYNGYSPTGDLFKALDGTNSNLRYDVAADQMRFYYKLENGGAPRDPVESPAVTQTVLKSATVAVP